MKSYRVYFSYYSEESGEFDDSYYKVSADNQFEARRMAWAVRDKDEYAKFQSCVKQCGVEWNASPLDLADYFQAQAAYEKCNIKRIENVKIPNAAIKKDSAEAANAKNEIAFFRGKLDSTCDFARQFGKPFELEPPDIYEEIHYAWDLVGKFDEMGEHEKAAALANRIEKARQWDNIAVMDIRGLFGRDGMVLPGEYINLTQFCGRDGIYPELADVNEREYKYISRWTAARHVDTLSRLPMLGEKDVISGSEKMPYDYCTLVLRQDALTPEYRKPENILWTPYYGDDESGVNLENAEPNTQFKAENIITGVIAELRHKDFAGVLHPEFEKNIDFDMLKNEYSAQNTQHSEAGSDNSGVFENAKQDEDENWEDEI